MSSKLIQALLEERRGYEMRGLRDRVKAVEEALRELGFDHKYSSRVKTRPCLLNNAYLMVKIVAAVINDYIVPILSQRPRDIPIDRNVHKFKGEAASYMLSSVIQKVLITVKHAQFSITM
jgi:hypothetical protein